MRSSGWCAGGLIAGFLGAPPYYPYADHSAGGIPLGGTQQANALAIGQSWIKMISFLNDPWRRAR